MDLGLKGKVALVAAASKGLGRAAALELAREGARVAALARSERIEETAQEIRAQTGAEVLPLRADITQADAVRAAVQATLDRFHQIDILILNSGGPAPGDFLRKKGVGLGGRLSAHGHERRPAVLRRRPFDGGARIG